MNGDFNIKGEKEQKILHLLVKYDMDIDCDGEIEAQWKIIEFIKEIISIFN